MALLGSGVMKFVRLFVGTQGEAGWEQGWEQGWGRAVCCDGVLRRA